ncbi:transcription initiation protein [Actinosynnema sp. ALI-1.44]|uniref:YciI family protein n=1 Tax=Actinosynnema sp. ALI-1.44 TaxID=1933779 RepID=UPI00097C0BE2|nr:YciI family protein [Actinosynnema sp. ALI-1.44]ONI78806.1 transcription initiation protein [Actinosynnema sp. ALI-1.44]
MRYLLMISADETEVEEVVSEEGMKAFAVWMDDLVERGVIRAHEGLRPSRTATTVRVRDDEVLLTDGPYIEAKEQIGGFALIEVDNLDEAIEIAAGHPACAVGQVEIRPVLER